MGGVPLVDAGPELIEREEESALLDALVDRLHDGGGALVVRGEAGIGKSVLLQRMRKRAAAQGARPLVTGGVESEAEFALRACTNSCFLSSERWRAADSQRQTLEAALGLGADHKPDPYRVAVAAFQLICEVAESVPLVLIVDDAHWLDRSTLSVLAFIGRRLEAEHVALVAAIRSGQSTPLDDARLPTLDLERLSAPAAARLLDRSAPELHPVLRARVLAESRATPWRWSSSREAWADRVSSFRPVHDPDGSARARIRRQAARPQPGDSAGLLAAALDSRASLDEIARSSGAALEYLQPAVEADLVEIADEGVRFRHPLIRSAVRQAASAQQVLEMYRALADIVADPERRLWHRAMAAREPDEDIAAALEQHARQAAARGAVMVAGAALERAAALTADSRKKGRVWWPPPRLPTSSVSSKAPAASPMRRQDSISADATWHGWPGFVRSSAAASGSSPEPRGPSSPSPSSCATPATPTWPCARWFRSHIGAGGPGRRRGPGISRRGRDGHGDGGRRPPCPCGRRSRQSRSDRARDPETSRAHAGARDARPGLVHVRGDRRREGRRFRHRSAVSCIRDRRPPPAGAVGPADAGSRALRMGGDLRGRVAGCRGCRSGGAGLARDTTQPQYGLTAELIGALVTAFRGNEPDLESVLAEPERALLAMKGGPLLATAHLARGAAALGDGRHDDAFQHLWPVFDENDSAFHRFMRWPALLDLVEAADGSGQTSRLSDVIVELEAIAIHSEPPILR